jgi:hypothetical protein
MEKIGNQITLEQIQRATEQRNHVEVRANNSLESNDAKELRERRKAMLSLLDRLQIDLNLPPLEKEELKLKAISFEMHLTNAGLKPEKYERAYILALKIYNETDFGKGPFNINHLIQAAMRIRAAEQRAIMYPVSKPAPLQKALPPKPLCEICKGTLIEFFTNARGERKIAYEWIGPKRVHRKCPVCVKGESK